jgi:hypothetical protein
MMFVGVGVKAKGLAGELVPLLQAWFIQDPANKTSKVIKGFIQFSPVKTNTDS